jgi:hypothetical protein
MKDLVVGVPKSALPVQQVAHVLGPASSSRQAQLFHVELFSFGREQDGAHVTSKAPVSPGPSQRRDIDRNRSLVAKWPT